MTPTRQYILFWYAAETVPPSIEEAVATQQRALQNELFAKVASQTEATGSGRERVANSAPYIAPAPFPSTTLKERIAMEPEGYEPVKHVGTGVDEDELTYESHLLPVDEAMQKLRGTISSDVVKRAWEGIQLRMKMERKNAA